MIAEIAETSVRKLHGEVHLDSHVQLHAYTYVRYQRCNGGTMHNCIIAYAWCTVGTVRGTGTTSAHLAIGVRAVYTCTEAHHKVDL